MRKKREIDYKLSQESAEEIIDEWFYKHRIHYEDLAIDGGPEAIQTFENKLIRSVREGRVEVNFDDGVVVTQHLDPDKEGTVRSFVFKEIGGKNMLEGEKQKGHLSGTYAMLASMAGVEKTAIANLKGADLGLVHTLGAIFSAV